VSDPRTDVVQIVALVLAVVVHETAHGWAAWKNGDPTAKLLGRITLNPIPHVDLFGSVILPVLLIVTNAPILIGWAKPVPVNARNFRNPRRGFAQVSVAGPASNFLLAVLAAGALKLWVALDPSLRFDPAGWHGIHIALPLILFLQYTVLTNLVLGIFNLFPIPPLDGGHFLMGVLPPRQAAALARVEPYGMVIVIGLVMLGAIDLFLRPILALMVSLLG